MDASSVTFGNASGNERRIALLLNRVNKFDRPPKKFMDSWIKTQEAEANSTARIFLDGGTFSAWFAYFLTKNAVGTRSSRFTGKADCSRLIDQLETEPEAARKSLAAQLAAAIPPDTQRKVQSLYDKMINPSHTDGMSQSQPNKSRGMSLGMTDGNCQPTSSANLPNPTAIRSSTSAPVSFFDFSAPQRAQALTYPSVGPADHLAENEHVLVNASLAGTKRLLPSYLSGGIEKYPDPANEGALVAGISMTFPNEPLTGRNGCTMALSVGGNKVQGLAKDLFEANVETNSGLRYVWLTGRTKIVPNPNYIIQGCRFEIIPVTFGAAIAEAIAASPRYQEDVRLGNDFTDSVSMVISHQADHGGIIYVSLGLWEGSSIRSKLYE